MMDSEVYRHYKLWPSNYIAYDMAHDSHEYDGFYTSNEKDEFLKYKENEIRGIEGNSKAIEELFLGIYENPLINLKRTR
jgi:hypothetical protein